MILGKKIEEIRKKPEHVRIKYVYGAVIVSMVFIVIIWIFSIQESMKSFSEKEEKGGLSGLKKEFEDHTIKSELPSLEDYLKENKDLIEKSNDEIGNMESATENNSSEENDK